MLSRLRFSLILSVLLVSTHQARAQGCLCASAPTVEQSFASAVVVFAGTVEKIDDPEGERIRTLPFAEQETARSAAFRSGTTPRTVTFRVLKWWKGDPTLRQIDIHTDLAGAPCSFGVKEGDSYLVFSERSLSRPTQLILSTCNQTAPLVCGRGAMEKLGPPLASFEEIDQAKLIARQQPFDRLGRGCMSIPFLIGDRLPLQDGCYYEVDAVIDEKGFVRNFRDLTDRTKSGCPPLDAKIIEAWRFRPAMIDGTPVQVRMRSINRSEPFTVADEARWRAADEARAKAAKKKE